MSNRLNAITVSLISTFLILFYYLANILLMLQRGGLNPGGLFRLWAVTIVASIILNISGNVITAIVINIAHAIKTNSSEAVRMLDDERDRLIALKGTRVAYIASSIGAFLSMLSFVLGQPALVMFSLLILSGLVAEIIGDLSQVYFYRRGF